MPDACLALQNEHGVDVNMLLYCCWIGMAVGQFNDALFERASSYSKRWAGNVVIPLREARTWMKHTGCVEDSTPTDACMRLRDKVKSVEFAAEKMQQEVLESFVHETSEPDPNGLHDDVAANLSRYLAHIDVAESAEVKQKLKTIVAAAFP